MRGLGLGAWFLVLGFVGWVKRSVPIVISDGHGMNGSSAVFSGGSGVS